VNLSDSNLTDANLIDSNLSGTNLQGSDLRGVRLTRANMKATILTDAVLNGVRTGGVTGTPVLPEDWILLQGYLVGPGADLTDADLEGIDLSDADLAEVNWANTICPDGSNSDDNGDTCCGHLNDAVPSAGCD
jgi:uncharacterized protein YjbI with pentapeptide repeats